MAAKRMSAATRQLFDALYAADAAAAKTAWATGKADVQATDDGLTPLHVAALRGEPELCRWLLSIGADVNARSRPPFYDEEAGATPLLRAAGAFHVKAPEDTLRVLLDAGADVHARDDRGRTALFYALEHPQRVAVLLEAGVDVDATLPSGTSALMVAVRSQLTASRALLEQAGASARGLAHLQLLDAAAAGDRGAVEAALAAGADVNYRDDDTALSAAAGQGHLELVRLLLSRGADPNLLEEEGEEGGFGPLSRAVYSGHLEVAKLLLENGADPRAENHGLSVLQYAKLGKAEGRRPEVPWPQLIKLIRAAVEGGPPAGAPPGGPALSKHLSLGPLLDDDRALLEGLDLADLAFQRAEHAGAVLLESGPLPVDEAAERWAATCAGARARDLCCLLSARSLDDVEPARRALDKTLASRGKLTVDKWLKARSRGARFEGDPTRDLPPDDEGGEPELTVAQARRALGRLRDDDVHRLRAAQPAGEPRFDRGSRKAGANRHLVVLRGPPGLAPILYQFGGWNDCPPPEVQALVLDHWHEAYGAELAYLGPDTLEVTVRRPLSRDQLAAAAIETGLYCSEATSLRELVSLVAGPVWGFWWD